MPYRPAETIRGYLDEHDGETRVPFHNLLTTWQLEQAGERDRQAIERELADAGVAIEPGLAGLGRDDDVTLRIAVPAQQDATEAPTAAPEARQPVPWQAELDAAGAQAEPQAPRPRPSRRLSRWIMIARRDLIAVWLILMSGAAAAAVGYLIGKGF